MMNSYGSGVLALSSWRTHVTCFLLLLGEVVYLIDVYICIL